MTLRPIAVGQLRIREAVTANGAVLWKAYYRFGDPVPEWQPPPELAGIEYAVRDRSADTEKAERQERFAEARDAGMTLEAAEAIADRNWDALAELASFGDPDERPRTRAVEQAQRRKLDDPLGEYTVLTELEGMVEQAETKIRYLREESTRRGDQRNEWRQRAVRAEKRVKCLESHLRELRYQRPSDPVVAGIVEEALLGKCSFHGEDK